MKIGKKFVPNGVLFIGAIIVLLGLNVLVTHQGPQWLGGAAPQVADTHAGLINMGEQYGWVTPANAKLINASNNQSKVSDEHAGLINMGENYGWVTPANAKLINASLKKRNNGQTVDTSNFPENVGDLAAYINGLDTMKGSDLNKDFKPDVTSGAGTDATIYVFREGDAKRLGTMVQANGLETVWQAIADNSDKDNIPSAFKWTKADKSSKIVVLERTKKSLSLDLNVYEIDNKGSVDSVDAKDVVDGGKLYGADHNFG